MRSKSSYEVRAERFIKMIAPFLITCRSIDDYYCAVNTFNFRYHRAVIMKHGISRIALITSDYVIKITYDEESDFGTCEDERLMYEEAKLAGFDYLFAQITHVEYEGKDYYIMPRINGIGKYEDDAFEYMTEEENDWVSNRIYDLHNKNYGWKNGHVVLIDYSAHY
jgi:hypothetical protein